MKKNNLIWSSLKNIFHSPCAIFRKITNGKLPIIINNMLTDSILIELKYARDALWVENPPVDMVVIACAIESKTDMPDIK